MTVTNTLAYCGPALVMALETLISCKLTVTNTLVYTFKELVAAIESFMIQAPGPNFIQLFGHNLRK